MIGSRILGAACAAILVSSLGSLAGCSSEEKTEGTTAQTIQAASVSLVLHDENGTRVGEGSGILISPRVVLTSGHLIAGKSRWTVTSSDGKTKATGVRGLTYDWMNYNSNKSHPRKHDVGVIYLDRPIQLAAYPKLSDQKLANGAKATRVRSNGASFEQLPATLNKFTTFPNAYVTDISGGERLDTGGAVLNDKNEIVGLVTGRGLTTGKLYIARVNDLVNWLSPKVACGHQSAAALNVRTYGTPPPKEGCEDNPTGSSG
ncbi:MAG TPA: trypsin-like serine protease, partial [Labilithrix sp.]|nr:trypsin-like serine protease [Labilithrix sp.]